MTDVEADTAAAGIMAGAGFGEDHVRRIPCIEQGK